LHAEVVNEPTDEFVDSDLRPDLKVSLHQQVYYFDFTVAHPLTESNLTSAQAVLGTTRRSEGIKDDKYLDLCEQLGAKFVPFAFETYGGLGARAKEFLSSLARFARENSHVIPPGEIMNSLRCSLAVVLQKGNALIVQRAMNRATREANKVVPDHIKRSVSAPSARKQRKTLVLKSPKRQSTAVVLSTPNKQSRTVVLRSGSTVTPKKQSRSIILRSSSTVTPKKHTKSISLKKHQ